jgi:hypothetical protein
MSDILSLYDRMLEVVATPEALGLDHVYLLIDQAALPNIQKRKAAFAALPHDSVLPSVHAINGASPLLLEIDSFSEHTAGRQLVQWLCEQGKWANGLTLLRTPLLLSELKDRLQLRTEAVLPDNYRVLLRFFDGRILPTLLSVLTPAQRKPFLGCAREWHYVDRDGALQAIPDVQFESEDSFEAPLELDSQQQDILLQTSEVDAVIDRLHRHMQFDGTPPEHYRRVAPLVATAMNYGIKDTPHLAMFSLIGLQEGPEFHAQAQWSPILEKVRAGILSFPQALDAVDHVG